MSLPPSFTATVTRRDGSAEYHEQCRMADVDREKALVVYGESKDPVVVHYETEELRSLELRWPEEG